MLFLNIIPIRGVECRQTIKSELELDLQFDGHLCYRAVGCVGGEKGTDG